MTKEQRDKLCITGVLQLKMPSVFDGDIPFLELFVEDPICGQKIIGKLWGKGGVLTFEGDAEESAKVFFEHVIQRNREFLMRS